LRGTGGWSAGWTSPFRLRSSIQLQHAQNRGVTWLQLLQQTSEWSGSLWGIPDTVDRDRQLAPTDDQARFNRSTPRQPPGTYWDYNDTRVNALCLALTSLFGESLPDVLATALPAFGDRTSWNWQGYGNESSITLPDRRTVSVVVGGGHWGGGLATSVRHDLILGRLMAGRGTLDGRRVLSEAAIAALLSPCPLQPVYGRALVAQYGAAALPCRPAFSFFATGVGMNVIWVDPVLDLVAVVRWMDEPAFPGFVEHVVAAMR